MENSNSHIPDLRTYAFHEKAAEIIRTSPERLTEVQLTLTTWAAMEGTQAQGWALKWMELINGLSIEEIAMLITKKGEQMDFYRKSSPFACLLSEKERLAIIHKFKYKYE